MEHAEADLGKRRLLQRAGLVFIGMAVAETMSGALRIMVLSKLLGHSTAQRLGLATAIANVLGISYLTVDYIRPRDKADLAIVGGVWYLAMVSFDIGIGYARGIPIRDINDAFNPMKGGYLGLYMSVLLLAPFAAFRVKYGGMPHNIAE